MCMAQFGINWHSMDIQVVSFGRVVHGYEKRLRLPAGMIQNARIRPEQGLIVVGYELKPVAVDTIGFLHDRCLLEDQLHLAELFKILSLKTLTILIILPIFIIACLHIDQGMVMDIVLLSRLFINHFIICINFGND